MSAVGQVMPPQLLPPTQVPLTQDWPVVQMVLHIPQLN
jgi:hypothetical protein